MTDKTIILGEHPIVGDLERQFWELSREVVCHGELDASVQLDGCCELVLLSSGDDNAVLRRLLELAEQLTPDGSRVVCHLLLQSPNTLQMLQSCDLDERITSKMDVYPTTMTEVWSRQLQLDYEPITLQSEKHAHLVIFGFNDMALATSLHAVRVAHFPNYVRDHTFRTRITIIDDNAIGQCKHWLALYQHLFDNSYYRLVQPDQERAVVQLHRPIYEGKREDFVDVEWEFVNATVSHPIVQEKLVCWSQDNRQLLSIVMTGDDDQQNITRALLLPDALFDRKVPIHIQLRDDSCLRAIQPSGKYRHLHPFGMLDRGYDVTLPWVQIARTVNHIYEQFYQANGSHLSDDCWQMRYAVEIDAAARDRAWASLSMVKRQSSISNALSVTTKLRSIGLNDEDWSGFFDIPQHELELLAQVEHNRWSVEQLILGYRPCTDAEQALIEHDITLKRQYKTQLVHYDLRAYSDLRPDETGKSVEIYDLCLCAALPLIAKTHSQEKGGQP